MPSQHQATRVILLLAQSIIIPAGLLPQDRRIVKAKERYEANNSLQAEIPEEIQASMEALQEQIVELQAQSEALGESGDLDASMAAFNKANALQLQLQDIDNKVAPVAQKKQYVDEISGLVYSSTDNEGRIADLQSGKHYRAWKEIREKLIELRSKNPPRRQVVCTSAKSSNRCGANELGRHRDRDRRDYSGRDNDNNRIYRHDWGRGRDYDCHDCDRREHYRHSNERRVIDRCDHDLCVRREFDRRDCDHRDYDKRDYRHDRRNCTRH